MHDHPYYHDWYTANDVTIKTKGKAKTPTVVQRTEKCDACGTLRITKIDVVYWKIVGQRRYVYVKGQEITRVPKPVYLRDLFFRSTTMVTSNFPTPK